MTRNMKQEDRKREYILKSEDGGRNQGISIALELDDEVLCEKLNGLSVTLVKLAKLHGKILPSIFACSE